VDAYFEPLAARQVTRAVQSDHSAVFNDTLLAATIAYLDLVRAQSEHAIAEYAVNQAQELARIADDQARTGRGLPADAERARAELSSRRRLRSSARERVQVVSAELARILRLEAGVVLFATDVQPMPVEVIDTHAAVLGLIALAWAARPELARQSWTANAAAQRVQQETLRPWVPNLHVGLTTGGFGGGAGEFFGDFSDRSDFDALLVWEFQNLGLGNRARRQEQESIQRQAHLEYARLRDIVAAEVVQAYEQVHYRREQIDEAKLQMRAAAEALPLNFTGILAAELRVIEAQQAISALADAQSDYVAAITDYNRAQFTLLRAIGRPPGSAAN
jgi:outer membrane protein TolC